MARPRGRKGGGVTTALDGAALIGRLPKARGRVEANRGLAELTWFRAGGPAEVLFTPADEADLAEFLGGLDPAIAVTVIGVGSNLLVRDGGVPASSSGSGGDLPGSAMTAMAGSPPGRRCRMCGWRGSRSTMVSMD